MRSNNSFVSNVTITCFFFNVVRLLITINIILPFEAESYSPLTLLLTLFTN